MKTKLAIFLVAVAAFAIPTGIASAKAPASDDSAAVTRSAGEVRIKGRVIQKSAQSVTVRNAARTVKFFRRASGQPSLAGIGVGQRVEAEGRRIGGRLTLTSIHRED
jgi:hypothetical protein